MEEEEVTIKKHSFSKKERLNSKKEIDALFSKGASFYFYPFSIKHTPIDRSDADCHQILISVSKRKFKRAVDRNRIKRLIRESYRLNKQLIENADQFLSIAYIYTGKEIHSFDFIQKKLIGSLRRLLAEREKTV
ncbi:ribonuclease P protein component [Reichenbachiella sp. 5M10]|uniref:ribonuclease P protein component n=1 Tax=Reichenbachiella sp. 5M10 TaxID=1889772 RepID=UPI000C14D82C|nr:ribonuclease P protein component [Reichenbachiella sp. 5M10]PIB34074.1 ribonuclease P protein component [Reichenbachiella sp. 5M10]